MIIERVEVEEGFMSGLDLSMERGLNVLVGPRGSGKTSIIELIRFCLGVEGFTKEAQEKARKHALSVLGAGQVTITLDVDGEKVSVARTTEDSRPRISSSTILTPPTILSQGEIERLGLDAEGRLRLIDQFRADSAAKKAEEDRLLAQISSVTLEIQNLSEPIRASEERLQLLASVPIELQEAQKQEERIMSSVAKLSKEQGRLDELNKAMAVATVRREVFEQWSAALGSWKDEVTTVKNRRPLLQAWPEEAGAEDKLAGVGGEVDAAATLLQEAISILESGVQDISLLVAENRAAEVQIGDEARQLRRRLDEIHEGAGAVAQKVSRLKERASQLQSQKGLVQEQRTKLAQLQENRRALLDELDGAREDRFVQRTHVADVLNNELRPRIEVQLLRYGLHTEYENRIAAALRGSQLHYNLLAPALASSLSPRELAEAIESGDAQSICSLAEIPMDRAQRIVSYVAPRGVSDILTSPLEDSVSLRLLDGDEYKDTQRMSTGQRCTVLLPILLGHHGQSLMIDQPEDHLDNAFIVDTVVEAILRRGSDSQLIFATHNANIPVLGSAARVIFLGSDGSRGFQTHAGELEDSEVVRGITKIMEGGRKAFERRATFYQKLFDS